MSQTTDPQPEEEQQQQLPQQQPQAQDTDKNEDKKEIADEEREKMLNAENTKHIGDAPAELQAEEQKPKRRIPIGAIKMPGLFRSKSKEPCKDDETKVTVDLDGDGVNKDGEANDKSANSPAKDSKDKDATVTGRGRNILQAIKVPTAITNVFNRKKKDADAELGTAGLASVETLDDGDNKEKNNVTSSNTVGEDGMETVRLDTEAADGTPPTKPHPFFVFLTAARRNVIYSAATLTILLLMLIIVLIALMGPRRNLAEPTIIDGKIETQTLCGMVKGLFEDNAFVFRGIPYAVPPVKDRRWRPPEKLNKQNYCWNGTLETFNTTTMCWQRNGTHGINGAEDCLYLDIYTPKVTYENPLAVVVMIGADTLSGPSPGIMVPNGQLAHDFDMVFVRPNFRLDVFGFLAATPLSNEAHPMSSGNYGLFDILTALHWVKLNIKHFGGDPNKVTLWGHRAGGTLVTSLIGSHKAKGLFQRAWISSGSAIFPTRELRESEKQNEAFLDAIKCKYAACLKNKNAEDIMEAVPTSWYAPNDGLPQVQEASVKKHEWLVKDDIIVKQHIGEILATQDLPVKIVMGTSAQSGQLPKSLSYNSTVEPQEIKRIVQESLIGSSGQTESALAQYNATVKGLHTMISDIRVVCPLMTVATMKADIPFYISTFPRDGFAADVDADAAAILGLFPMKTPEQQHHLFAIQKMFKHFVWHGEVKDVSSSKRILIVDQDVIPQAGYDNCKLWVNNTIVPAYARID